MSASVICQGCGKRLQIPEDYTRRKMQCPDCGVYCDVPAPAKKKVPAASAAPRTAEPPSPSPAEGPSFPEKGLVTCRNCGELVKILAGQRERQRKCPNCGSVEGVAGTERAKPRTKPANHGPESAAPAPPPSRDISEPLDPTPVEEDEDSPYDVIGGVVDRKCPNCRQDVAADAELCVACGFNLQTGEKPAKVYEKVELHWDSGLPLAWRIRIFAASEGLVLTGGLVGAVLLGELAAFLGSWAVFTGLLAFLLGTFDRVNLARNKRGQVQLAKTWRICFVYQKTIPIRWQEYEGIALQQAHETDYWDWMVFLSLSAFFCIPGLLWWFLVIRRDTFDVALTRDHGYPEIVLYRGGNQEQAIQIAETLSKVTELPYRR